MSKHLVFARLHLPRPLDVEAVIALLGRLAADRQLGRLILEARSEGGKVRYLLGARSADVRRLGHLLHDFLPGCLLDDTPGHSPRPAVAAAGRLRLRPAWLPLNADIPETVSRAVLSALAVPLAAGETLVVQVVLGERIIPNLLPADMADPGTTLVQLLTGGTRPAGAELRTRLRERARHGGFVTTIRVGAAGATRQRRTSLLLGLLSALTVAQGPGVWMRLIPERPVRVNQAWRPWRYRLRLSVPELASLVAWPYGEKELPGVSPLHPRPLRAAAHVHQGERVFARSAAPGDGRLVGISAEDQTMHGIAYGPSGAGKTTVFLNLILADIAAGRPVVVLDPKQQLIDDILARVRADQVERIVELNAGHDQPVGFNPLDSTGRDPDVVVDGVLAVFASIFADGFGPRTADIFSSGLRTLARGSRAAQPATLVDLPRLFTDAAFRRPYVGRAQGDLALAQFWAGWDEQGPAAQAAVLSAPMNKLRQFLLRPAVVRMLDQRESRFRLRDVFRDNKVVLVPLNEGLVGPGTASLLGSLIIAEVWQAVQERAIEPDAYLRPGTVYVDEAPRFVHLPTSLADALAISRSLSVGWFLAAQFRSQFPPELRTAVDINARSKIAFATEADEARDLARLAPGLEAEDLVALPKYHAYANLAADGAPSGWALVETLPPPPVTTDIAAVRAAIRANYAPATSTPVTPAMPEEPPVTNPAQVAQIGRKRRTKPSEE